MRNRLQGAFASFQKHNVKYVIIGGIASVLHGAPRATFDLDILIEASPENASRLLDALTEAGFGTAALTSDVGLIAMIRQAEYNRHGRKMDRVHA